MIQQGSRIKQSLSGQMQTRSKLDASSSRKYTFSFRKSHIELFCLAFFHSLFRINVESFIRSFKMGKASEHTSVTPTVFSTTFPYINK